ncbi:hypothetical protein REPUB_Repub03eG0225900 [Reevesia pubescens]
MMKRRGLGPPSPLPASVYAYRCLVKDDDREAPSFLFESVEPGSRVSNVGRYNVVGAQPTVEVVAKENKLMVMDHEEGCLTEEVVEDPMLIPRRISEAWKPQLIDDHPDAFCGGWIGYFSYDTVCYVEKKKLPFSKVPHDDRNLPDIHLGLYNDVIVFDHVEKKAYVIHWVRLDRHSSVEKAYNEGVEHLEKLVARVQDVDLPKLSPGSIDLQTHHFGPSLKNSNMASEEFKKARGCILVASSPEILTRVKKNKVVNRPLAGTAKRGRTPDEDELAEKKLLSNEKEFAEHIMLVDLGRNDVGKVFLNQF